MNICVDSRSYAFFKRKEGARRLSDTLIRFLLAYETKNPVYLLFRNDDRVPEMSLPENFQIKKTQAFSSFDLKGQTFEQKTLPLFLNKIGCDLYLNPYFTLPLERKFPAVINIDDMIPYIVANKMHDIIPASHTFSSADLQFNSFKKRYAKSADIISVISERTKNDIVKFWGIPPDKIKVIYTYIDDLFYTSYSQEDLASFRRSYNLPDEYVLYVGTLEPRKNVIGILKSIHRLREHYKIDIPIVFLGPKGQHYKEHFQEHCKKLLNYSGVYEFSTFLPKEVMPLFYQCATLLLYPSFYEGFGLPVLEAMVSNIPVVTSDKGSLPEVYGDAACVCDPFSAESIADCLYHVLTDLEYRKKLVRNGSLQCKHFTQKKWNDKYYKEIYSQFIAN